MDRTLYDQNFMKRYNPFLVKNNRAEFYNQAYDPMKNVETSRLIARSQYDIDKKSVNDGYIPSPEEISEYYMTLKDTDTVFNNPSTRPIVRSNRDIQYNNLYNSRALSGSNFAEFFNTECSSCNKPTNFSNLDHTYAPGYFGKNLYNINANTNFTENALSGKSVGCGGCNGGNVRENFNWTPENTKLSTEDVDNVYSFLPLKFNKCQ